MRQDVHFVSSRLSPSLITREGLDKTFTSFHHVSLPLLKEREGLDGSVTFCSFAALRVTAIGRNLKTRCVRFALAGFVEPSARVRSLAFETKRAPQGGSFCFKGERGIRTLGPVTDSGFRDRPIRPLWHLSEVCTI